MHLFSEESLAACFHGLNGRKAVGVDGVSKAEYGERLESNLEGLTARMKRMGYPRYKLALNEQKTRLVGFGRPRDGYPSPDVFDFLGFTFYWGRSRKGAPTPKVKTSGKPMHSKLKAVNTWGRSIRSRFPLKHIWAVFCSKLRGHIQYYGVSFNFRAVQTFQMKATRLLFKWLNRRSQRRSFNWERFALYMRAYPLPKVAIYHALF